MKYFSFILALYVLLLTAAPNLVEDKWKVGLEAYYFSPQKLSDGATGKQYVLCGFMVEKLWEKFSVYINFENFLDARQTRFDTIYTGTLTNPVFRDIYAPLDGF